MAPDSRTDSGWQHVFLVALVVLAFGLIFLWPHLGKGGKSADTAANEPAGHNGKTSDPARSAVEGLVRAAAEAAEASVSRRWDAIVDRAQAASEAGQERLRLFIWTLFTAFDALETQEQHEALLGFFESGRDVRFGNAFSVTRGGWLSDWPTLRVALFDYVAQRDPELAREIAVQLLQSKPDEPGEWALALRELVRGKEASEWSDLVTIRTREFLHDPDWSSRGLPAWMEGVDVVVAGRSAEFLPDLDAVARQGNTRSARFAAFLASDRLTVAAPGPTLRALNEDHALFSEASGVRAGMFARADVRVPEELAELERYFLRDDVGPGERAQFSAVFPHHNVAVSYRLLTTPKPRSPDDIEAELVAARAKLEEWLADERLVAWHAAFGEIRRRIAGTDARG